MHNGVKTTAISDSYQAQVQHSQWATHRHDTQTHTSKTKHDRAKCLSGATATHWASWLHACTFGPRVARFTATFASQTRRNNGDVYYASTPPHTARTHIPGIYSSTRGVHRKAFLPLFSLLALRQSLSQPPQQRAPPPLLSPQLPPLPPPLPSPPPAPSC